MGFDPRIGRAFLNAGPGYGGSCFPKDVEAFIHIADELGYDFGMLRETQRINRDAHQWPVAQLRRNLWNISDKRVAVLGLSFKPGTDDLRESPALKIVEALQADGAEVRVHDPVAMQQARDQGVAVAFCDTAEDAIRGAHAVVLATEWDDYVKIAPERLAELLEYPVVIDARAGWDVEALHRAGLTVASVGQGATVGGPASV